MSARLRLMGFVYILASKPHGTLYIGVTSDLAKRIFEHKTHATESFTKRYDIGNLVYFEHFEDMQTAIAREKRLKRYNRSWKIALIEKSNPHWYDLYANIAAP